ncbi:MAG: hypothetical protein ACRCX2_00765 [Paraclostridium sp.]
MKTSPHQGARKRFLFLALLVYWVSPVDLMPMNFLDDIIATIIVYKKIRDIF